MGFEKLKDLLPYSVHKIEEKFNMKPEEANKMYEEERENERQYWIKYWIKYTQGENKQYWVILLFVFFYKLIRAIELREPV